LVGNPALDSDITGTFGAGTTNLFTLAPGQVNNTLDAGFFRCALIGERVWYDTNRNDILDNPENGINGLRVNLWRNHFGVWTIWDFTVTGHKPNTPSEDGWWQFCAPPGQYYVQIIIPPLGLVQVQPNRGNNPNRDSDLTNAFGPGTTNSFTISSGGSKLDLAGGFYPMAIAGNLVWNDLNMNGIQDLNEPKVSGVKVEAFDADNHQKLGESVTDQTGIYEIDYLPQKNVYFRFSIPDGFSPTIPNAGDDTENSDVDHSYGQNTTRKISMKSGVFNNNIDLGIAFGALPVSWLNVYGVERQDPTSGRFTEVSQPVKAQGYSNSVTSYHTWVDIDYHRDIYYYRVRQVDYNGSSGFSDVITIKQPLEFSLHIYPNPAVKQVNLEFATNESAMVKAEIFNAQGVLVQEIIPLTGFSEGTHTVNLELGLLVKGSYVVKFTHNGQDFIKPLIIME
jgi:hypothetical protein